MGIGAATARLFAAEGASVGILDVAVDEGQALVQCIARQRRGWLV
jgi:NAD(P)-dependent dehydrogenase (short-subunit alcohol dehydrogenase family)